MNAGVNIDIVELCGGEGLPGRIAVRRRLKSGGNFDIVTDVDLNDPKVQHEVMTYILKAKPLVVVLSPVCTPFGPLARFNKMVNYDTWLRSYRLAAPHGRFCGGVAMLQLDAGRHFVLEQPQSSTLLDEPPWPKVSAHPNTRKVTIDQCATGKRGRDGLLVKKPTDLFASHEALLHPFQNLRCNGRHQHSNSEGKVNTKMLAEWTYDFASRIVDGIKRLKKVLSTPGTRSGERRQGKVYPTVGTSSDDIWG